MGRPRVYGNFKGFAVECAVHIVAFKFATQSESHHRALQTACQGINCPFHNGSPAKFSGIGVEV